MRVGVMRGCVMRGCVMKGCVMSECDSIALAWYKWTSNA